MRKKYRVNIIGGGLAGCEAAYFLANKGVKVKLYEMRPRVATPIHKTDKLSELVCSNSLKSKDTFDASGLLKVEMRQFNCLSLEASLISEIPGGTSLIVDRECFSNYITNKISNHPNIKVIRKEVTKLPKSIYTIVATGPLTSDLLSKHLIKNIVNDQLYFYDAIAPIIDFKSIDLTKTYYKSRYDKGEASYINCPMTKEEYDVFYKELINCETTKLHDFEKVFESCMPVEVLAKRGYESLLFGPLKPVGLEYNGKRPFAVIQLRQDDFNKQMYNIVGFQTNLKYPEQRKVLRLVPGLEHVEIIRYGVIHRNTYLKAPSLMKNYQSITRSNIFYAGQITGVEGYLESASSGILCASYLYQYLKTGSISALSNNTIMGALNNYLNTPNQNFVPMNANYSIIPEAPIKNRIKRREFYVSRSKEDLDEYINTINRLS
jgi:methylenetetrahydrofolate--tRNA-(uracil-5-)-methyltransferase